MVKILGKLSIFICIILLFLISFVGCDRTFLKYFKSEKLFKELKSEKELAQNEENQTANTDNKIDKKEKATQEDFISNEYDDEVIFNDIPLPVLSKYESLYDKNNDLFGWITIDDTKIDYPVMHTPEDFNYYVHRDWNKDYSYPGSIFIDGRCDCKSDNIIIYGHNMKNLTMFGNLIYYKNKSFYEKHKYITFDTIYEEATYEIIAVSQAFINESDLMDSTQDTNNKIPYHDVKNDEYLFYNHIEFDSQKEIKEYVDYMKENSYYAIDSDAKLGDKLITLCTCTNTTKYQNERLLIVAKKIE